MPLASLCQQGAKTIVPALLRGQFHPQGRADYAGCGGIAGARLKSFIERLAEEKRALGGDIKEVFAEAKGTGFEPRIMRQILKIRKMDKDEHDDQESLLNIYKRALKMLPDANATAQAAGWQHPSSKPVVYGRAQRQFGIVIPTPELMDLASVAKLGRRIADSIGITPAHADDESERSAEPALELTLGLFLEQELDRVKERPL